MRSLQLQMSKRRKLEDRYGCDASANRTFGTVPVPLGLSVTCVVWSTTMHFYICARTAPRNDSMVRFLDSLRTHVSHKNSLQNKATPSLAKPSFHRHIRIDAGQRQPMMANQGKVPVVFPLSVRTRGQIPVGHFSLHTKCMDHSFCKWCLIFACIAKLCSTS